MKRIEKINGYVYEVTGEKGFETYFSLGKDPDDEMWKDELEELEIKHEEDTIEVIPIKKKGKKKKSED